MKVQLLGNLVDEPSLIEHPQNTDSFFILFQTSHKYTLYELFLCGLSNIIDDISIKYYRKGNPAISLHRGRSWP
ncbi:hypothetical protein [Enterocloster sp.]|uniref:hypothetical protein n=1 Tax=Enterocloster sp. TaxID=2719315 RepID=UPI0039A06CF8